MKASELKKFHHSLLELKQELKDELSQDQDTQTVGLDQSRIGRLSRMDALQNQQIALGQKRRLENRLRELDGALTRIDNGSFGNCFICGEPLSIERLDFNPTVTRCIKCVEQEK